MKECEEENANTQTEKRYEEGYVVYVCSYMYICYTHCLQSERPEVRLRRFVWIFSCLSGLLNTHTQPTNEEVTTIS